MYIAHTPLVNAHFYNQLVTTTQRLIKKIYIISYIRVLRAYLCIMLNCCYVTFQKQLKQQQTKIPANLKNTQNKIN